jgi:hypothetical protein
MNRINAIASYGLLALLYVGMVLMVGRLVFARTLLDLVGPGQADAVQLRAAVQLLTLSVCVAGAALVHAVLARK